MNTFQNLLFYSSMALPEDAKEDLLQECLRLKQNLMSNTLSPYLTKDTVLGLWVLPSLSDEEAVALLLWSAFPRKTLERLSQNSELLLFFDRDVIVYDYAKTLQNAEKNDDYQLIQRALEAKRVYQIYRKEND